jgi:hypothetical protein
MSDGKGGEGEAKRMSDEAKIKKERREHTKSE